MGTAPRWSPTATPFSGQTPYSFNNTVPRGEADDRTLLGVLRNALATGRRDSDAILHAVADAARVLSGADGAALALRAKTGIVCAARSGNIAPDLGTPLNTSSGISGECYRTGRILVCHDTLSDARVDPEVCRTLGIRSIAVVPLHCSTGIVGLLEAFSTRPNSFDGDAISCLRQLAELAQSEPESAEQVEGTPAPLPPLPKPPSAASLLSNQPTVEMRAVDEGEDRRDPTRSWRSHAWIIAGATAALLMVSAVAWWSWGESTTEIAAREATSRPEGLSPAATDRPAPRVVAAKPFPGWMETSGMGKRSNRRKDRASLQNAAEIHPAEISVSAAPSTSSPSSPSSSLDGKIQASTGNLTTDDAASEPPPTVNVASAGNPNLLAGITSASAPMPKFVARISKGVSEPKLIRKVDPIYPPQARIQRLTGNVILEATIAADGSISGVSVVSGPMALANAATTALRQWRYRPALLNGTPTAIQKQITFVFTLP